MFYLLSLDKGIYYFPRSARKGAFIWTALLKFCDILDLFCVLELVDFIFRFDGAFWHEALPEQSYWLKALRNRIMMGFTLIDLKRLHYY